MVSGETRENGLTHHVSDLVQELTARGWEVALLGNFSEGSSSWLRDGLQVRGIRIIDVSTPSQGQNLVQLAGATVRGALRARGEVADFDPDVVHVHTRSALALAALVAERRRIAFTVHNTIAKSRLTGALYRIPAAFVGISQDISSSLSQEFGVPKEKVKYIPNGIRPLMFSVSPNALRFRAELGLPVDSLVCLTTGRLDAAKGHDVAIRAIAQLRSGCPQLNAQLVLVGDGDERQRLECLARRLGVDPVVHFAGWRSDVPEILPAADVFVLLSRWEGFPLATIEAMHASLPVVRTRVSGWEQTVDGETGYVVRVDDVDAVVDRLTALGADPTLRASMGIRGRERAVAEYSLERMAEATEELYGSIICGED